MKEASLIYTRHLCSNVHYLHLIVDVILGEISSQWAVTSCFVTAHFEWVFNGSFCWQLVWVDPTQWAWVRLVKIGPWHVGPLDRFWLLQFIPHSLKKNPWNLESDFRWVDRSRTTFCLEFDKYLHWFQPMSNDIRIRTGSTLILDGVDHCRMNTP